MSSKLTAAFIAGGIAIAALTAGAAVAADATISLGAIVPSSGPFAEWGRSNTAVMKFVEQEINAAGGVNGAKLKLVVLDDSAKPAQAATSLRKLAGDDKVLAIAGPLTSSAAEVSFPIANELKIVSTSQASSKPGVAKANRPWAFRNTIDEGVLAKTTIPIFKTSFKVDKVAIIYDAKDATAATVGAKIMPSLLKESGLTVLNDTDPVTFNTGDLDVSAQITKLKALDPDGIVVSADYSQAVTVLREMKRQGLIKPVIGSTQTISTAVLKAAPEIPIVAPATFYPSMDGGRAKAFVAGLQPFLRKEAGLPSDVEPSMYDANIYEIVGMYVEAIKKAGITGSADTLEADRTKIRDYLAKLDKFEGLAGPISFNDEGDAIKTFYVLQGQNGKWTTIGKGCSTAPGHPSC